MRAIIQRVGASSVAVDGALASRVGQGYCVLLGISAKDTPDDARYIVRKLLGIRLFPDPANPKKNWCKNIIEISGEILLVSQFTLCHVLKGNKPDFHNAMGGEQAKLMFDGIVDDLRRQYAPEKVQTGVFGAHMHVSIDNDGPVTIVLDSEENGAINKLSPATPTASSSSVMSPKTPTVLDKPADNDRE